MEVMVNAHMYLRADRVELKSFLKCYETTLTKARRTWWIAGKNRMSNKSRTNTNT